MRKVAFTQLDWITGEGHAAQTETLTKLYGTIVRIDVIISSVTDNPTVAITITDTDNGGTIASWTGGSVLADGTHHIMLARSNKATQDANFNEVPLCGDNLTLSADPSADAGGAAQTLTVDVVLYLEEDN